MSESQRFLLSPAPHIKCSLSTARIMWWVTASLLPVYIWAIYIYGLRVLGLTASGIIGSLLAEWLVNRLRKQRQSLLDGSGFLTGILLVGTLSPGLPLWMPALGGFVSILFGKMLFGGLGYNIFNPALIGRAFLMASFPAAMTTSWLAPSPGSWLNINAVTQPTPLNVWKLEGLIQGSLGQFFIGLQAGSIGEVSVLLIMIGAGILLWKKIITPIIPLSIAGSLFVISIFSGVPFFHMVTGGLWFGAFYMATDYVTAPLMPKGQIIFGIGIGILTGVIRIWGGYPEGICYAILIMNAVTPGLNQWFRPRRPQWEGVPS